MVETADTLDTSGVPSDAIVESSGAVTRETATRSALHLLRYSLNGVLGTLSKSEDGAPFGSVAPYALDQNGAPLIYVAGIAEHTRNIKADPRASLLVHAPVDDSEDIQTKARLCLMGTAEPVAPGDESSDAWARYRCRVPAATEYQKTHDFSLWRLTPTRVRWIGGFGEIFWLRVQDFQIDPEQDALSAQAKGIVDHMNEDHLDAIQDFYKANYETSPTDAHMVAVDVFGMDFESPSTGRLRVDFVKPSSPETVRKDVIEALKLAREQMSTVRGV